MENIILVLIALFVVIILYSDINYQQNQTPYYFLKEVTHLGTTDTGHSNGYVAILDPKHPMFGVQYMNMYNDQEPFSSTIVGDLDVHGGVTYSKYDEKRKAWVIGFDVCHYCDTKKTMPYKACKAEALNMYNQVVIHNPK